MKAELRLHRCLGTVVGLAVLVVTTVSSASVPSWWINGGVLNTSATPNDYAPVAQGQVKNIAAHAYAEMSTTLHAGGAGSTLTLLIVTFSPSNNYLLANIGQLKSVAQPFYDRLIAVGYTNAYPWAGTTPTNDYLAANIGQLKNLFSWDLTYDSVGDGIPDWWRRAYFGGTGTTTNSTSCALCDPDGDGFSNLQEYQADTDPTNFVSQSSTNLPTMTELPWFGGFGALISDTNCSTPSVPINDLVDWPKWGMGSARGTFDKTENCAFQEGTITGGTLVLFTNYLAFSWAKIQYQGSNDWEWGNADGEMAYLTNLDVQIGVCWNQWYVTNGPCGDQNPCPYSSAYCTNGCETNGAQCNLWSDPPWAAGISTAEYALCKGLFVSNFVARYSTPAWKHVNAQGITNGLRFVEPENEPNPWDAPYVNMSMAILQAAQGARTNGVQLIGWASWAPVMDALTNVLAYGLTNWVDGISFHFYPYSDDDPSVGHPTQFSNWGEQTNAFVDATNCEDCVRIDQWLDWMYTQIPTNFACYVTEVGFNYQDVGVYPNLPNVPIDPNRMAKYVILLKAGGVTGFNYNGELWYYDIYPTNYFPNPPSSVGRAAIWTAYWLQNLPFSGVASNGNALAYSFGSGSNEVTLAWTYEGTVQSVTATGYSGAVDLYSNSVGTVSVLTSDITVFPGAGTLTFP